MLKLRSSAGRRPPPTCIDVGLLIHPESLDTIHCRRICIEDGIYIIEPGRCTELVALPAFYNAHVHILDYRLAGANARYPPEELLPWPTGFKARMIQAAPGTALRGAREALERMLRVGWGGATIFLEGPGSLCMLVKSLAREIGIIVKVYGRSLELDRLRGCDGFGVPHLESRAWVKAALRARNSGISIGVHVSETRLQTLLDDYNVALYLRPHHVVHLLYAPREAVEALAEAGVYTVYSPASNAILWGRLPRVYPVTTTLLGSDNAGWVNLDPWLHASLYAMLLRETGLEPSQAAREALRALIRGWEAFGFKRKPLLVLHAPQIIHSVDPYAALIYTAGADQVIGLTAAASPS